MKRMLVLYHQAFKQFVLYKLESLHKIYELDTDDLGLDITSEAFGKLLKML